MSYGTNGLSFYLEWNEYQCNFIYSSICLHVSACQHKNGSQSYSCIPHLHSPRNFDAHFCNTGKVSHVKSLEAAIMLDILGTCDTNQTAKSRPPLNIPVQVLR